MGNYLCPQDDKLQEIQLQQTFNNSKQTRKLQNQFNNHNIDGSLNPQSINYVQSKYQPLKISNYPIDTFKHNKISVSDIHHQSAKTGQIPFNSEYKVMALQNTYHTVVNPKLTVQVYKSNSPPQSNIMYVPQQSANVTKQQLIKEGSNNSSINQISQINSNNSVKIQQERIELNSLFKQQFSERLNKIKAIFDENQRRQNLLQYANEAANHGLSEQAMQLYADIANQLDKIAIKTDKILDTQAYSYFSLINLMIVCGKDQKQIQNISKLTLQIYNRHTNIYIEEIIALNNNLAFMKQKNGKYQQAIKDYESVKILQNIYLPRKDQRVLNTLNNLASVYYKIGKINQANNLLYIAMKQGDKNTEIFKIIKNNYQAYSQLYQHQQLSIARSQVKQRDAQFSQNYNRSAIR